MQRTGIPCEFDLFYENHLEPLPKRDVALYRITQELLTNVLRHAKARRVRISLTQELDSNGDSFLILTVSDDGVGLDVAVATQKPNRFGLRGVRERAENLGGTLILGNNDQGGAKISVKIPENNGEGNGGSYRTLDWKETL